jgi:ferredoxin
LVIGVADDARLSDKPVWRISVTDACIGSGSCLGTAPGRFAFGPGDVSQPVHAEVEEDEAVLDAAASCPVEAILVHDLTTGGRVEP